MYGVEPWYYYIINGFLNFNILFPLALFSMPAVWFSYKHSYQHIVASTNVSFLASSNGRPYQTMIFKLIPVYLWLAIFSWQKHKEERFLFVIYPLICFNASVSIAFIRGWLLKNSWSGGGWSFILRKPSLFTYTTLTLFTLISISRIMAVYTNYRGLFAIYDSVRSTASDDQPISLCLGTEWYRFNSHYLMPKNSHVYWINSGFDGHLPKYFIEASSGRTYNQEHPLRNISSNLVEPIIKFLDRRPGTFVLAGGFNHLNKGDKSAFVVFKSRLQP